MKILNPTKLASRKILMDKMSRHNTPEENEIIKKELEKHNQQTGDGLCYMECMTFEYTFSFANPKIDLKRNVILKKYESDIKRYKK